MITLDELRTFTADVAGDVPPDATAQECLDKLRFRLGWLETVWQACHNRHVGLEQPVLVVNEPTPAAAKLAATLGVPTGKPPACVATPDRKEEG